MHKEIINIRGMHCKSCEIMIEENVLKVKNVAGANANHKKGILEVTYKDQKPNIREIREAVAKAGYAIGESKNQPLISREPLDYFEVILGAAALMAIWFFAKAFGIFDLNFDYGENPSFPTVVLIGLAAGISTCMALVGGLVLSISARHAEMHPEAGVAAKFRPHVFFNLGRILSYAILGGVIGSLGSFLSISGLVLGLLILAAGAFMLFIGLKLTEIFPRLSSRSLALPKFVSRIFGIKTEVKEYSHKTAFISGALTFFLPCGFTQAMQLYAISTGSFGRGAMVMALFALGTTPGLLGIGGLTSFAKGDYGRMFFKFAGVVAVVLGVMNMANGMSLLGVGSLETNPSPTVQENLSYQPTLEDGKQVIRMDQTGFGYSPKELVVKKGIPVKWIVDSQNSYTCAAFLAAPSLGISEPLKPGINVFEFMPDKSGVINFSCSMGMYRGRIKVID